MANNPPAIVGDLKISKAGEFLYRSKHNLVDMSRITNHSKEIHFLFWDNHSEMTKNLNQFALGNTQSDTFNFYHHSQELLCN